MKKFIIPFLAILCLTVSAHAQKVKDKEKRKHGVLIEKHKGPTTTVVTPVVTTTSVTTVHHPVVHHAVVHHTVVHHPVHHTVVHHTVVHHAVVHHAVVHRPVVTTTVVQQPSKVVIKENGMKTKEIHKPNKTKTKSHHT